MTEMRDEIYKELMRHKFLGTKSVTIRTKIMLSRLKMSFINQGEALVSYERCLPPEQLTLLYNCDAIKYIYPSISSSIGYHMKSSY